MAQKHWTTAERIAKDITGLDHVRWQRRDPDYNAGEGVEGFASTYEWDLLGGAASDASMQALAGSAVGAFLGVAGKMVTGLEVHQALLNARTVTKGSGKSSRPIEVDCSRVRMTVELREGRTTEWFRIKLYLGNNGQFAMMTNGKLAFKGAYLYDQDTLHQGSRDNVIKSPWKRRVRGHR